jgi:hypothetical protein
MSATPSAEKLQFFQVIVVIEIHNPAPGLWPRVHGKLEAANLNSRIIADHLKEEIILPGHTFSAGLRSENADAAVDQVQYMVEEILRSEGLNETSSKTLVFAAPKLTIRVSSA